MFRRTALLLCLSLGLPALASAQDDCLETAKDFDAWLNCRVGRVIALATGPAGGEKQAESPSLSDDSPTLVDTSSASDFVGFGMTLLGLHDPPDRGTTATTGGTSVTTTAYSLLALAYGRDPLADRDFYYAHPNWRRLSFTVGRQPPRDDGVGLNSQATNVGVKLLLWDQREVARDEVLTDVQDAVTKANVNYARIAAAVQEILAAALASGTEAGPFAAKLLGLGSFKATLGKVDGDLAKKIDAAILARIEAEVAMRDAIRTKIAEIKRRPQASLAWASNLRNGKAADQHRVQAIVDYRMAPRLELTANAGVDFVDRKNLVLPPGIDMTVGRAAAALTLALADQGPELLPSEPVTVALSADLQRKNADTEFRVQVKIDFPLARGMKLPVSFTWADSPERINEKEVRGMFGFTLDTSKLAAALR
jgi:hypothetical protein